VNELQPAIDFLTRTRRFIITAHETPDGDAIGSEAAMFRALTSIGKEAIILNADPMPSKLTYLDSDNAVGVLESERQLPADIHEFALLMLDTNDVHNIGQVATLVLPRVSEYFIIDHHERDRDDMLGGNFIQKGASSTCEIIYQLLRGMNVTIDFQIAQALYTGIVYDTGCFIYPKTSALTFEIARDLVAVGVQPNFVYARLYESNSISALVLQSRVLATLELRYSNHVSILTMRREMILDSGANYEEADQLINIPLKSEDIRVSVFFKENLEGLLRCSLRSKGKINVAEIAQQFGGGGHTTAAGFKCRESIQTTCQIIMDKLAKYFV
jgi:phosphoesterase RecJ-like protein